jgi:hypothetical protein
VTGVRHLMPNVKVVLPACTDGSAYASLITSHGTAGGNTFMTRGSIAQSRQLLMLLVLVRSMRSNEHACRRPFILLRGSAVSLPAADVAILEREGDFLQREIAPIKLGVPPFDKLHAWNLSSSYKRILVVDADAMLLQPIDELFDVPQKSARAAAPLTMAHHGYDKAQDICHIPLERRGVGGFYVMTPSQEEFRSLVRETLSYKEEQTGVACYFSRRTRLSTLPCPYFYDIVYEQHVPGGTHHLGCLREGIGRAGVLGAAACNASAEHVRQRCTWERSYASARAVHFKGTAKPWRVFSCHGLRNGRLRLWPGNATLGPNDVLSWSRKRRACVSRHGGAGVVMYGAPSMQALPLPCCRFTSLIKAEWWHHYRKGPTLPSLGTADSWIRPGRWLRNKTCVRRRECSPTQALNLHRGRAQRQEPK